jgi:hypothetical protein
MELCEDYYLINCLYNLIVIVAYLVMVTSTRT